MNHQCRAISRLFTKSGMFDASPWTVPPALALLLVGVIAGGPSVSAQSGAFAGASADPQGYESLLPADGVRLDGPSEPVSLDPATDSFADSTDLGLQIYGAPSPLAPPPDGESQQMKDPAAPTPY